MFKIISKYLANLFNKSAFVDQDKSNHYDHTINGSYKADDMQIDMNLCVNGQAILGKNAQVQKSMLVNGTFIAHQSTLMSDLTVNGSSSIDDTQIQGVAKFRGNLEATSTIFLNKLEILSSLAEFENSKTQLITFKELPSKQHVQRLKLEKNTEVQGDIIFEAGNGEVICDETSKIHGQIIGGRLVNCHG
jgi:predicted acyltransferase (DUF342 family)